MDAGADGISRFSVSAITISRAFRMPKCDPSRAAFALAGDDQKSAKAKLISAAT
jgi:hypothetical protein